MLDIFALTIRPPEAGSAVYDPIPDRLLTKASSHNVMLDVFAVLKGQRRYNFAEATAFHIALGGQTRPVHAVWEVAVAWREGAYDQLHPETIRVAKWFIKTTQDTHPAWWATLRRIFTETS